MAAVVAGPMPRSPPTYPDLCGRERLQVEVQMMSREIGVLEAELESLHEIGTVSGCCKEVDEYVGANPDPIIPVNEKGEKSCCLFRWLREKLCFNFWCICCCARSSSSSDSRTCKCGHMKNVKSYCCLCHEPPCSSNCCRSGTKCCRKLCDCPSSDCLEFSCGCVWSCSKCTEERSCYSRCSKNCCISHCVC